MVTNIVAKEVAQTQRNKLILLVILVIIILLAVSCVNQSDSDWKKYMYKESGINFIYPKNWKIFDDSIPQNLEMMSDAEIIIYTDDEGEQFTPNINLIIEKSPFLAPGAIEQVEMSEASYELFGAKMGISGYERLDLERVEIGHIKAAVVTYEMVLTQTEQSLTGKQLIVPFGQDTYILTCTALTSQWPEYKSVFDEVIQSFSLE